MTVTKLSICNGALRILKEGSITQSELTNNSREPARLFNAVWDDGGLDACLNAGEWRFARRSVVMDYDPDIAPDFGYQYVYEHPDDFVRLVGLYSDDRLQCQLDEYRNENAHWFTNIETMYATYISNDAAFGGDYSIWPNDFLKFVQAHFASEIAGPLTLAGKEALQLREHYLPLALGTDGQSDPPKKMGAGSWVSARMGGRNRYSD